MVEVAELSALLAGVVGEPHVTTAASELHRHGDDESFHAAEPPDVVV